MGFIRKKIPQLSTDSFKMSDGKSSKNAIKIEQLVMVNHTGKPVQYQRIKM